MFPLGHSELEVMVAHSSRDTQQAGPGAQRTGQSGGWHPVQGKAFSSLVSIV